MFIVVIRLIGAPLFRRPLSPNGGLLGPIGGCWSIGVGSTWAVLKFMAAQAFA